MAYSSLDPTTGAPVFLDSDTPDPAVNPSQVAAYAAEVGTRLIGSTTERTAYTYAREGLEWYDTTLDELFIHNGSGWVSVGGVPIAGTIPDTGTNVWDVTLTRVGKRVFLEGRVFKSSGTFTGAEGVGTLPVGFRPDATEVFPSTPMVTTGAAWIAGSAYILSTGSIQVNMAGAASVNVVGFNATWLVP